MVLRGWSRAAIVAAIPQAMGQSRQRGLGRHRSRHAAGQASHKFGRAFATRVVGLGLAGP